MLERMGLQTSRRRLVTASGPALALALALALAPPAAPASAQQLPPQRCGAAANCGPSGFQTLRNDAGEGASFFGVRMWFGRGLSFGLVRPPGWSNPFPANDPVGAAVDIFVRRHPLRRPDAGPNGTPDRPSPSASPAKPGENPEAPLP